MQNHLTENENEYLKDISNKLFKLRNHLSKTNPIENKNIQNIFSYLDELRGIQGNLSNDVSFMATLLAKSFLINQHGQCGDFDAAEKALGAPGLDIDIRTTNNRIIAEIKTTVPYNVNDFGAAQNESIKKDIKKLKRNDADFKYLFVTNKKSYEILKRERYQILPDLKLVLLPDAEVFEQEVKNTHENDKFVPECISSFKIKLGKAYYNKNFFNVDIESSKNLGGDREKISIYLGSIDKNVHSIIDRTSNPNNAVRIRARQQIGEWFQENYQQGEVVNACVVSKHEIFLFPKQQ